MEVLFLAWSASRVGASLSAAQRVLGLQESEFARSRMRVASTIFIPPAADAASRNFGQKSRYKLFKDSNFFAS
jgi:hypothetical protein